MSEAFAIWRSYGLRVLSVHSDVHGNSNTRSALRFRAHETIDEI